MPTERAAGLWRVGAIAEPATTRILRLATGTALALAMAMASGAPGAFIAPILVAFLLTLPLPAPTLKGGIVFVLTLVISLCLGLLLLPVLLYMPLAGVLLLALSLFGCFYYSARGGSPLVGAFLTLGLTVIPALGSESVFAALEITKGLAKAALVTIPLVWLSYGLFPDPPSPGTPAGKPSKPPPPGSVEAGWNALRSTLVVLPAIGWFLVSSGTASYVAVLIKIATLGQQANTDGSRDAGLDLILSTLFGGIAAILLWFLLQIWPSLLMYTLLVFLGTLIIGARVFAGPGLTASGPMWSYALITMLIILGSTVSDSPSGDAAGAKSFSRIVMFLVATVYAVVAVEVFDHLLRPRRSR